MKYLELASRVARANTQAKSFLFGAVAIKKDGLIVTSKNIRTQFPDRYAHAECRCLSKAGYGSTLYVVRITRNGDWGMAKPCKNCETLIKNKGVIKTYYSIAPREYGVLTF